ncbi:MAG: hypothetical protein AB8I08_36725 [Sandaracinaceae bacterium]
MSTRIPVLLCVAALAWGCTNADSGDYDADWDANGPVSGGKADGLFDAVPDLEIGGSATGDVGADRLELYRIRLQRTDRIEVSMTVTSGDLNPHLSVYYGTSTYISSESWDRTGATLTKVYEADDAGTYLLAVRAYREEGDGDYELNVRCVGGPCAGELPPPESEYDVGEAYECISQARACAFERLPRYNGRVGEARAQLIMQGCLEEASLDDGTGCTAACEWTNEDDEYDTASSLCDAIVGTLPFYADQSEACLGTVTSCMDDCIDAADYGYGWDDGELWSSPEALCWENGFNGTCDGYARATAACGGELRPESAGECTALCHSTTGAHIDDLDTLCSSDHWCEEYCDVDMAAAQEECGAPTEATRDCFEGYFDDNSAWICEDTLDDAIEAAGPVCTWGSALGDSSSDLEALGAQRGEVTASSTLTDLTQRQIIAAAAQLGFVDADASLEAAFDSFDEGTVYLWDLSSGGFGYEWVKAYAGDTEIGIVFAAGTTNVVAEVSDGDLRGCR